MICFASTRGPCLHSEFHMQLGHMAMGATVAGQ